LSLLFAFHEGKETYSFFIVRAYVYKVQCGKTEKTGYAIKKRQDRKIGHNVQQEAATRTENTDSIKELFVAL
jgi:hypothetical protein